VTLQVAADAEYNMAGKKESWTMNPSRSIMMHEPPAHLYSENGSKLVFHWHYARGSTTLSLSNWSGTIKNLSRRFSLLMATWENMTLPGQRRSEPPARTNGELDLV